MRVFLKFIFKMLVIIVYRPKVIGKENLPKDTGALICPNHVHNLDSVVVVTMLKRPVRVLAKEELFSNACLRFLAKVFGVYPVKRGKADLQAIKISLKLLKKMSYY